MDKINGSFSLAHAVRKSGPAPQQGMFRNAEHLQLPSLKSFSVTTVGEVALLPPEHAVIKKDVPRQLVATSPSPTTAHLEKGNEPPA
jgi:hypothetical protein